MLHRLLLGVALSWLYAVTLGLLFAACASGTFSLTTLLLPGVVPVALLISTVIAILIAPLAVWALKTGTKNLRVYGPILWVTLAAYEIAIIPRTGPYGTYGLLVLAIIGLLVLGFMPVGRLR